MNLQNSFVAGQMISKSEMLAAGLPIGNPYAMQAPFNKRYEMPFFIAPSIAATTAAISAAGAAIGAAGVMGAAGAIGTAALATVSTIGTIAAVAGTAMTVVGMITGDKGLMKLGGMVGLAGGVASLAAGGLASLAAGGQFSLGTAGVESANAANSITAAGGEVAETLAPVFGQTQTMEQIAQQGGANLAAQNANLATQGINTAQLTADMGGTYAPVVNNMSQMNNAGGLLNNASNLAAGGKGVAEGVTNVINYAKDGATVAANPNNAGFFSDLMSQMTAKDWAMLGGSAVIGGAKSMAAHAQTAAQQEAADNLRAQRSKNLNTIPQLTTLGTLGAQPAGA